MASYQQPLARLSHAERERVRSYTERKDINTTMPGRIVSFDPATQTAEVEIMSKMTVPKRGGNDGETEEIDYPNLQSVPVVLPRGGGFAVTKPIKPGDGVMLNFSQRPLDSYYVDGEKAKHESGRMHDLSDAIATPGFEPGTKALSGYAEDRVELRSEDGKSAISMTEDGRFKLLGSSGEELFTIVSELLELLTSDKLDIKTGSSVGKVHALENRAKYAELKSRLDTIKG